MCLNSIHNRALGAEGVGEEEGLVKAEDGGVGRDGRGRVIRFVKSHGELRALIGGSGDAGEDSAEEYVEDVKANGGGDTDFGRDEKGDPEGNYRGDKVGEGGLPVVIEDGRAANKREDGDNDNSGERGLRDLVEGTDELKDRDKDDSGSNEAGKGGLNVRGRVNGGAGRGAADAYSVEKAIEEGSHTYIYNLLSLVGHIVITYAKGSSDSNVFNSSADENGNTAGSDL